MPRRAKEILVSSILADMAGAVASLTENEPGVLG
jgi:hypothetical protein